MAPCLGTRADETHLAYENVEKLGEFIDLCFAQKIAHGEDTRIVLLREDAAGQVGTVLEHGGELENIEVAAARTDAGLKIEDIVFA